MTWLWYDRHEFRQLLGSGVVKVGLEVFLEKHTNIVKGQRVGLLTNLTGVNHQLEATIDLFYKHDAIQLTALFGPEHGLRGEVQEASMLIPALIRIREYQYIACIQRIRNQIPQC